MKYGEVVRDLAAKGANWIYYDTNFRYLRQQKPADFPWGNIHFELWIRSQQFPHKNNGMPPSTSRFPRSSTFVPIGYCRKFHRGGNCTGCSFKHECRKCHQSHPNCKCNFRAPGSKPPSQTNLELPTPVRINRLAPLLSGYFTSAAEHLITGFCFGFPISFLGPSSSTAAPNLLSAGQHPDVVDRYLAKEVLGQRVAGPFSHPPLPHFRVSPIGVVPKKTPGEFRCIQHLSYPYGASVNDGIPVEHCRVTYSRIDDAAGLILRSGVGSCRAKTDIKSAFRIIPIRPADYNLLGFYWRGSYYFDRCLPMGLASSCKTFEALSTAVQWISQTKLGICFMLHLLGDVLIISASHEQCSRELSLFLELCSCLGIPMAPEKTVGPSTVF